MPNNAVVLAIDPGYDRIGWAVGEKNKDKPKVIAFGCIQTLKTDKLTTRYQQLQTELQILIEQHQPSTLAIESLFFSVNKTSALKVAEARGIIISQCVTNNMEVFEYHPNSIKLAVTGTGKADKKAVEKMIRLQLPLPATAVIDDAIDALAILLTDSITRR
jgi:crossover junction endodeoxyribonuclease RuvC